MLHSSVRWFIHPVVIGFLFGASMKLAKKLSEAEIRRIGSQTGGRTIFFGGLLFILFAFATLFGWMPGLPIDTGYVLIGVFMLGIAVPAFVYSFRQVMQARRRVSA